MRSTVVAKLSLQMLAAPQDGGARAVNPGSPSYPLQSPPLPVRGTYVSVVQGVSAYVQRLAVRIIRVIVTVCQYL